MKVTAIKTKKVIPREDTNLKEIVDAFLPKLAERSIVAITSKIVAICEGAIVKVGEVEKNKLIEQEAEYFLPPDPGYSFYLTIKYNLLIPSSGIDESNGNGYYILWPRDPQKTANEVRAHLCAKHKLKNIGVIITDSKTTPLRWGVEGATIAHSGFAPLKNYIGTPDIFGRELHYTKTNVMDSLGNAAVLVIGEGAEQTPLAVIEDAPFVEFQDRNPLEDEVKQVKITMMEDDLYRTLLTCVKWQKGGSGSARK
ncbi:MAG: hypothetical protein A3E07_00115 [Candidatus Wildermuthbacteria bacterium RIFCSPHIGHO2_12_FULL_45_9]|uniref:Coenzyme F420:L-glutamate ligase-like domain-containing protein n=1 Tax=Candidatus Wildermuthbacteria bacterium RIFCSPHIGHO2_02_FULL_45_25 TaxID=1802450 RepID=A0A1G2QYI4_9BACT|nr:MAG: hypothetical protein A2748_01430 [Candidatus Wildermuthbacteria bacterium RIFCSPHIGHO2_01_FULL_45_20]OHA65650.1 MAG: hypothetical protein A3C04_01620 [Candidatus Wildermuthbacteria bacterium RIFCSPHIGHO2_02_FULL_45_25]OHA70343.1 MAG: hypothetical protein A3E07_00115 [Candidatus Wildermuthbacteria bacterium RIFCSPHIGHO2_12_FULL_45_9]